MNCRMLYVKQIVFKKVFAHELSNAVFIYKRVDWNPIKKNT